MLRSDVHVGVGRAGEWVVVLIAALVFVGTIVSPPALMDDVDGAYAQIARTMLESGDWVTARLNGIVYFDKPPGQVWAMAASFAVFGVHDWAARLPMALAAVVLCWVVYRFGRWGMSDTAGFWAGLVMATCVGMWLFSRVRIPDVYLTLSVTLSLFWALKLLEGLPRKQLYAIGLGVSLGVGMLFKGLPALVFPGAALFLYLLTGGRLFQIETWRRLLPLTTAGAFLAVAAPWHVAATLANPPYFDWSFQSAPDEYRGFFWRYFVNEHVLRYLGLRYPKDYSTVPPAMYWLGHLLWLFPWSAALPAAVAFAGRDPRGARVRRLALCWAGFVLVFFALSTSQEYYTMCAYPAFALLVGQAIAGGGAWVRGGARAVGVVAALACVACLGLLIATAGTSATGDISSSLTHNPDAYTLSLGHMQDLTLDSFAYLRGPLVLAALAFAIGAVSAFRRPERPALLGAAAMMVVFFQAARWAMVSFDPYLSSRPLARALDEAPPGELILDDQYYAFSSLVFYRNESVGLWNGRVNNIEYGSYAPGAPDVFVDDAELVRRWRGGERLYLATFVDRLPAVEALLGEPVQVIETGGKALLTNRPIE